MMMQGASRWPFEARAGELRRSQSEHKVKHNSGDEVGSWRPAHTPASGPRASMKNAPSRRLLARSRWPCLRRNTLRCAARTLFSETRPAKAPAAETAAICSTRPRTPPLLRVPRRRSGAGTGDRQGSFPGDMSSSGSWRVPAHNPVMKRHPHPSLAHRPRKRIQSDHGREHLQRATRGENGFSPYGGEEMQIVSACIANTPDDKGIIHCFAHLS